VRTETAGRPPGLRRGRAAAGAVLFLSFVDVFALLPTVAPHVEALGAGPRGIGIAVGAYSLTNLPANVVGGILVDRVGRRRVTLLGLVLAAAAVAGYAAVDSVATFVGVRALHGIAGGILVPAVFAAAGDRAAAGEAGRAFGRLGAVIGAAAVVAPATAGIVRQVAGTDAVFLGVSGLLLVGALIAWVGVHDRAAPPAAADLTSLAASAAEAVPRGDAMRALLADGRVRRALVATAVLTAAVGVLAGFLPGAAEDLGAAPSAVGGLFTAYALVAGAVMLSPLSGRVDRRGADGSLAAGLALLSTALLTIALAPSLAVATAGTALFGAGYGLLFPAATGVTSLVASTATRGRAFGLFNAAFSVGLALGPPSIGWLIAVVPTLDPFLLAALLCLAGALGTTVAARRPSLPDTQR
jgi:DHA1 family multidrug resistance protein-like MFS transporter